MILVTSVSLTVVFLKLKSVIVKQIKWLFIFGDNLNVVSLQMRVSWYWYYQKDIKLCRKVLG